MKVIQGEHSWISHPPCGIMSALQTVQGDLAMDIQRHVLSVCMLIGVLLGTGCSWAGGGSGEDASKEDPSGVTDARGNTEATGEETDGAEADSGTDVGGAGECLLPIEVPMDEPDLDQKKFALSMFHFNLQYVAGGLETVVDGEIQALCGELCKGWTDEKMNDWIVTDTFEPVLDFYMKHPEWRVTFEMQSMMLEWIGERFPALLAKLQQATQAGKVEMVSFHHAAQLFVAFPRRDMERSVEVVRQVFDRYCIPLSGVVFNQEGQAGEGKHAFMADHGYAISVFPKNLYAYVREGEERWPYYRDRGVDVIIGPGSVDPASGIELAWVFFDDGELLAVPASPYLAPVSDSGGVPGYLNAELLT